MKAEKEQKAFFLNGKKLDPSQIKDKRQAEWYRMVVDPKTFNKVSKTRLFNPAQRDVLLKKASKR